MVSSTPWYVSLIVPYLQIGIRPVQVYPEPFPQLNLSRFLSGVISATRNRWQSHMDDQGRLHTTFEQGRETEDDLRKLRILLKVEIS